MASPADLLRATLFGDVPMAEWPPADGAADAGDPWDGFVRAREHLAAGDQDLAIREWAGIGMRTDIEARHRLQAWTFLRSVGVQPDASIAGVVLGVVAEVAIDGGHDVLAAYEDGSVRFLHHQGRVSVIDAAIDDVEVARAGLLAVGQAVADRIGPWDQPTLPPVPSGHSRFTMLAVGGPRFGMGPDEVLRGDQMAGALFGAATQLLVAVVALDGGV